MALLRSTGQRRAGTGAAAQHRPSWEGPCRLPLLAALIAFARHICVQAELQEWDVVLFDGPDGTMALGRISQVGRAWRTDELPPASSPAVGLLCAGKCGHAAATLLDACCPLHQLRRLLPPSVG